MNIRLIDRVVDLTTPLVMGVLNITPDSFFDGGRWVSENDAVTRAMEMIAQGADFIDVGGESTRPGAAPVSEQEELDRVIPIIERLHRETAGAISIDTSKPAVMQAAIRAGASMINDVNALQAEGAMEVARSSGAGICLMHRQGEPGTMQQDPHYANVLSEVAESLSERANACIAAGVRRECIVLDPGFGFGKRLEHNLQLLAGLDAISALGYPVLIGVSRKSMLGGAGGEPQQSRRMPAGLAAAAVAIMKGAAIVRTHDVWETRSAVQMAHAIRRAGEERQ
ncbi:MAG: dihydropteroate synthase [Panacagrimonas sp.]